MGEGKREIDSIVDRALASSLSRRSFVKGGLAAGSWLALSGFSQLDPKDARSAAAPIGDPSMKTFVSACPRNCYDTCSQLVQVKDGVIRKVDANPMNTFTGNSLCLKGYTYTNKVYDPNRIKYPMMQSPRGSGNWKRISWDQAMDVIAKKVLDLKDRYGSTYPICMNKYSGNFNIWHYCVEGLMSSLGYISLVQGTPCWPAGIDAQGYDYGYMWNTDPEDFAKSKYFVLWGSNPAWTSIHTMKFINKARENGAKMVVIDPICTSTASKADLHIQIRPSTDGALALGMARYILDNNLYDKAWVDQHSSGFGEFADYLKKNVTVEWASKTTGVPVAVIEQVAKEFAAAKPACTWIGYGFQRHTNGGQNVRNVDALAAMTGNATRPGGGANYGHLATWGFNYHAMVMKQPAGTVGSGHRNINMNNFGQMVLDACNPPIKMLWTACRNTMSQDPETPVVKKALEGLELVVVVDHAFTRTAEMADIVLPTTTHYEHPGVNVSYWHYWIALAEKCIEPLYESKTDLEIAWALSKRMNELRPGSCTYPTGGDMQEWTEKEFNDGIHKLFGISSWKDLKKGPQKAKFPNPGYSDNKFPSPSGKYEFKSIVAQADGHPALPVYKDPMAPTQKEYTVRLLSPHSRTGLHSQFQNNPWMMAHNPEPVLEIHPDLAAERGIKDGDKVKVSNDLGSITLRARLTKVVPKDVVATYENWFWKSDFCVNNTVKAIPADMGKRNTGNPGIAFHDNFVKVEKA
ncbi:MAG: molybdopterin-dependent oxidoreductase [Thermodesulfovibrionales bacterium]